MSVHAVSGDVATEREVRVVCLSGLRAGRAFEVSMARWISLTGTIEDDRGVRREARALPGRARGGDAEETARLHRLVLQRRPPNEEEAKVIRWIDWIINGGILLIAGWMSVETGSMLPLVIGMMVTFGWSLSRNRVDAKWKKDRESVAALPRVCPVCAYRLEGLGEADDGCVVCPECGAAWKFPIARTLR